MNLWPLVLVFVLLLIMFIPLLPAFIELKLKRDADPVVIGRANYMDIESYSRGFEGFLKSKFKDLVGAGLSFAEPQNKEGNFNGTPYLYLTKPVARQEIVTDIEKNNLYTSKIILSKPDLELPSNMLYENEIFSLGNLYTGRNNYIKAALGHGEVVVQPNTEVLRWIASRSVLKAQGPAVFHGRLHASERIVMEGEILYKWMAAPEIVTNPGVTLGSMAADFKEPEAYDETPIEQLADIIEVAGGTAFVRGDLETPARWRTNLSIIATGRIVLKENSCIGGKIKANDGLVVGTGCHLLSSAVCSKDILVRDGTSIAGPLISEEKIEMINAKVGAEGNPSSIYAREISLIGACRVHGSVFAEDKGLVRRI